MELDAPILVTGATGMVGRAVARLLHERGYQRVLALSRAELDLREADRVRRYFARHRPEYVLMIAAKVGGIAANQADPVGFLDENLRIEMNLLEACHRLPTRKNLLLGSSCIYPRDCPQPMREEYLLAGPLEPTNEGYALAKIVGLKLAQFYHQQFGMLTICPMPCNIYGTGDHFDLQRSHVLSALVRRFVDARDDSLPSVTLWGTGQARREFIHVSDVAEGVLFLMERHNEPGVINLGTGSDVSIRHLASVIAQHVGYRGEILWDATKPDGMPRKCLDIERLARLGFRAQVSLESGLARTIAEYIELKSKARAA